MSLDRTREDVTPLPKQTREWNCPKNDPTCARRDPCASCRGRRNRRQGLAKQRAARRAIGIPDAKYGTQLSNEESWGGTVRVEVKSGGKAKPVWTRYYDAERQAEASRAIGDPRPFMAVFMPPGLSDGLCVIRLSKLGSVVEALTEQV